MYPLETIWIDPCIKQNLSVKNSFVHVDIKGVFGTSTSNRRKSVPRDWKQSVLEGKPSLLPSDGVCSDVSTEDSPCDSIFLSMEDKSDAASSVSWHVGCGPCIPPSVDAKADDFTLLMEPVTVNFLSGEVLSITDLPKGACAHHLRASLEKAMPSVRACCRLLLGDSELADDAQLPDSSGAKITAVCVPGIPPSVDAKADKFASLIESTICSRLRGHDVKPPEKSIAEGSRRMEIYAEPRDGAVAPPRCFEVMEQVTDEIRASVEKEGLSLLSARVDKKVFGGSVYGYKLRSSVACIPEDKLGQICWDVLQKGSCRRRKCCHYHPQPCDVVKFSVVIRSTRR
jgi:hypothetical protein